jgi:hypothetical protein
LAVSSHEGLCQVTQGGSARLGYDWRRSMICLVVEFICSNCFCKGTEKLLSFWRGEVIKVEVIENSNGGEEGFPSSN